MATEENIYLDGGYLERHPEWHAEDSPWKAAKIKRILDRNGVAPETICEVGCGAAGILVELQKSLREPVELVGYEISPQACELARERIPAGVRIVNEDLLAAEVRFDLLLCVDVFEHVEDLFGFLRGLRRKAGRTIFHIPLDLSAQTVARRGRLVKNWDDAGHIHFFTRELALRLLRETGYRVVDEEYTASSVDLGDYSWLQRAMKLPRQVAFRLNPHLAVRLLGGYSLLVLCE